MIDRPAPAEPGGVENIAEIVARNLKRVRAARGISLSALARDSGVARATLYQMEAAQGNPTMDTLFAVSTVLRLTLSDLVTDSEPPTVQVIRASEGPQVARTAVGARLIRRFSSGSGVLELYDLRVFPDEVANAHAHPAGVLEHVLVSSGRLLTGPEHQTAELGPGDYMSFRADVPHTYAALDGDVVGTLIMDYPPAIGLPGREAPT